MPDLKPCKSCGHELSESADTCPSCGRKSLNRNPGVIIATVLIAVALAAFVINGYVGAAHRAQDATNQIIQDGIPTSAP